MPSLLSKPISAFAPRARTRLLDWCIENVQTHDGRPYDHFAYPHLGAPGGPCDSFDDPQVRDIWLQFASRLGKTFFGNASLLFSVANRPAPMMFASAQEKLAVEVVSRVYGMLARCKVLKDQMRPENRRTQDRIDLDECRIWVGWSRSTATLADKAVKVGQANEIDKWERQSTSKEADPLKLFDDRFKEYPAHKKIKESTPSVKGKSRVERGRLQSSNCRFEVPCPHCSEYQPLKMEQIHWEKNEAGKSDKDLARKTAHYVCCHCRGRIEDHHRPKMMRRGVWCPEGCTVDSAAAKQEADNRSEWRGWRSAPWIVGVPIRDGRDAGYQLSSLYALSLGWGDIAAEFVACKDKPQDLRNFINQWLGETWEVVHQKQTWQQLGERIIKGPRRFVLPNWASLVTVGIDAQEEGQRLPWSVVAWGPGRSHAVIAYGEAGSFEEVERELIAKSFDFEDGKGGLRPVTSLIDSGNRPLGIYEWCRSCAAKGLVVMPCKGSSTAMESDYSISLLGPNTAMPGMRLVRVDTIRSQSWIDRVLHSLRPDDVGSGMLHAGSTAVHQDFLEQVLNDAAVLDLDKSNNEREKWERIDSNVPNDFRDAWRYAYVAMLIATRGRSIMPRGFKADPPPEPAKPSRVRELRMRSRA